MSRVSILLCKLRWLFFGNLSHRRGAEWANGLSFCFLTHSVFKLMRANHKENHFNKEHKHAAYNACRENNIQRKR